jgi:hypothetical protein
LKLNPDKFEVVIETMKIPPKIQRIADRLKPRLPAANYGLASAIPASKIKLKGSKLSIFRPSYLIDSKKPLPSFVCGSASRLTQQKAFKYGLDSSMLKMAFPVMVGPGFETFGHGICYIIEGGDKYLIGLTPFDKALGICGVTRFDNLWEQFIVNEYQELQLLTADRVTEASGWDLLRKYESFSPFAARSYRGGRLGLLSLQLSINNGYLRLSTLSRIVYFQESSSAFISEWACNLNIRLPIGRLDSAVRDIKQLGRRADLFTAIRKSRYAEYFEPDFKIKRDELGKQVKALYNKTLPALIELVSKLPLEGLSNLSVA